MFSAIRKNGMPYYLFPRHSREELKEEKKKEDFYCPECKEKVIMKMGTQRMEHFAHRKGSQCSESYERESAYHLNGKLHLFQWLESQKLQPVLEPYYDCIRQRPDIGFMFNEKPYALEFQCSTIPPELMAKRTKHYRKIHAEALWILGGKNIKRKGEKKVSLTNFDYFFASKNHVGSWYLPAYCPASKIFILLTNLTPISTKNAFTHFSIIPLQKFTLQKLLEITKKRPFSAEDWKKEIRSQKLNVQMRGFQQNDLLKELYRSQLNISLLPPFIGIPVPNALVIESAPLIWQTYLFIDRLHNRNAGEIFTFNDIYHGFIKRLDKGQIKVRTFPLVSNCNQLVPLMEYLLILVELHILESLNSSTFRIKQKVLIPEHTVLQQKIEEQFYTQYETIIFQ